ncbi:hypothetical protein, partial [Thiohalocapsa sp.]|uniref:hypothetical protein n=1 Tax=Thiohalocapsa sp. TaxID=2497641 RepID=UPI0025E0FE7B
MVTSAAPLFGVSTLGRTALDCSLRGGTTAKDDTFESLRSRQGDADLLGILPKNQTEPGLSR